MRTELFDYHLPPELIAATPAPERDQSRLLIVHRSTGELEHRQFPDLDNYLDPGDVLVVNDSRVLPARLRGHRVPSGGAVEILLLERQSASAAGDCWTVMARPAKKMKAGERLRFGNVDAVVVAELADGERQIEFGVPNLMPHLQKLGELPLPPYIMQRRKELEAAGHLNCVDDAERYQTVYAHDAGSVAAPTAGLHFTRGQLERLQSKGVELVRVTLHVGAGTFKPVEVEDVSTHPMHTEHYEIAEAAALALNRARKDGRRIVAVGTTVVRTLESAWSAAEDAIIPGAAATRLLITPGFRYQVVGALVTNFHLPRSTLLMLVSAFASRELVLQAYQSAITNRYRFYSYGDAMLLL